MARTKQDVDPDEVEKKAMLACSSLKAQFLPQDKPPYVEGSADARDAPTHARLKEMEKRMRNAGHSWVDVLAALTSEAEAPIECFRCGDAREPARVGSLVCAECAASAK